MTDGKGFAFHFPMQIYAIVNVQDDVFFFLSLSLSISVTSPPQQRVPAGTAAGWRFDTRVPATPAVLFMLATRGPSAFRSLSARGWWSWLFTWSTCLWPLAFDVKLKVVDAGRLAASLDRRDPAQNIVKDSKSGNNFNGDDYRRFQVNFPQLSTERKRYKVN